MNMAESQNIEYKLTWRDEYLKWICGFANAQGGKIYVGIDDQGNAAGLKDYKKLMEDIPNKAVNSLGIVVDVNLHGQPGKRYIEIAVPVSTVPVAYHGVYHYRSGSTKQELKGIALQNLLLKKIGKRWENIPLDGVTLDDLSQATIESFVEKAVQKDRIPDDAKSTDTGVLLKNLNLITDQGELTNAAMLLFAKNPSKLSVTASFKIGRFGKSNDELLFQDIVETNIFDMPEKVMEILESKYLIRPITYQGLQRLEPLEYPKEALREAILNSIVHKEYSSTYIFLRVYDDRLHIWNPGALPEELDVEKLKGEHSSYPRNKNIANVFFKAGYIEAWGRGTNKIINACLDAGLPEPLICEELGGVGVTFLKDIFTENYFETLDLNKRQVKAVLFAKEKGEITNSDYQDINSIKKSVAAKELQDLTEKGLLIKIGTTGRGTKYILSRMKQKNVR